MCYDTQICRPCQCTGEGNGRYGDRRKWVDFFGEDGAKKLKEEYSKKWLSDLNPSKKEEIKKLKNQVIINENFINQMCENEGFKLLSVEKIDGKRSEFTIQCHLGHISEKKYMNFRRKSKFKCSKCFYESIGLKLTDEEIKIYENYKKQVRALTAKTYRGYKDVINPNNLPKGEYHLDHKFSVSEGFKNNVNPHIMSAKENLEMITSSENLSKNSKCSITLEELLLKTEYLLKNK
jgi:hypothetical protein